MCEAGFFGKDCSGVEGVGPAIDPKPPTVCDAQATGDCAQVVVIGTFVDVDEITCKFEEMEVGGLNLFLGYF